MAIKKAKKAAKKTVKTAAKKAAKAPAAKAAKKTVKKAAGKKAVAKKAAKKTSRTKKVSTLTKLEQALFARMVELDELAADAGLAGAVAPAKTKKNSRKS